MYKFTLILYNITSLYGKGWDKDFPYYIKFFVLSGFISFLNAAKQKKPFFRLPAAYGLIAQPL